jgi:NitT/TauT family transport system substrate-binding protein
MTIARRHPMARTTAVAGAALALLLTACGTSTPTGAGSSGDMETIKIMVGGLNKQIYLPAKLTEQLGFFKQAGINVEISDEPSGVNAETAMLSGQVDGAVGFYDHTVDLQAKGKFTQSVVQFSQAPGEVELCRTDVADQIRTPADWKGRKLGVTSLGSSTYFLTLALAKRGGVATKDITTVAVQAGQTFIAAMDNKAIDCGMTTEPTITALLASGKAKVMIDMRTPEGTRAALGGLYPAASVYMTTDFVNRHKAAVQKMVNAYVRTLKWINSHTAAEITDMLPPDYYAGVGKEAYVKALDASKVMFTPDGIMPPDGPPTVLDALKEFNKDVQANAGRIDLSKTYTTEFARKAG